MRIDTLSSVRAMGGDEGGGFTTSQPLRSQPINAGAATDLVDS